MEQLMTQEDSYADRRQLFKNIWDTAMNLDEKDADIMNKPKVIKTLRLDEVDRCVIGQKKKQRIKNLRTVCKKILDLCDRQEADDVFYEKFLSDDHEPPQDKLTIKSKKLKRIRVKRKIINTNSLFTPLGDLTEAKKVVTDKAQNLSSFDTKVVKERYISRHTGAKTSVTKHNPRFTEPDNIIGTIVLGNKRKIIKTKSSKRKSH